MEDKSTDTRLPTQETINKLTARVSRGSHGLRDLIEYGFYGLGFLLIGAFALLTGLHHQTNRMAIGAGFALLVAAFFCLRRAWRNWSMLKAISK